VPVRVAVVDLPQMLSEIVKDILNQAPDVAIVDPDGPEEVDVAIVAARGDELPPTGHVMLLRRPTVKVLTISGEGRHAHLYELLPHRTPLGEVSAETLLAAVRDRGAGWG
jgi:hypothetical protein